MRRTLTTVAATAALMAGIGLGSVSAADSADAATMSGTCDTTRRISVGSAGYYYELPYNKASESWACTLAEGSAGSAVTALQKALKYCNYASGLDVDGIFGPKTEDALRYAQQARNTKPDGVYGPLTRDALWWVQFRPDGSRGGCGGI